MKKTLLIIGGSVINKSNDGSFFTKSSIYSYVNNYFCDFDRVVWATSISSIDLPLSGKINPAVEILQLNVGKFNIFKNSFKLVPLFFSSKLYTLGYFPAVFQILPLLPFLFLKSKRFVVYLAGDYRIKLQNILSEKGLIWFYLYSFIIKSLLFFASSVIARGKLLFKLASLYNKSVYETVPIGYLSTIIFDSSASRKTTFDILFIGKLINTKGVLLLLDAFKELSQNPKLQTTRLHLVGDGLLLSDIKSFIRMNKLSDSIILYGWVDNETKLNSIFSLCDILVVPSTSSQSEGVPRVIDEALTRNIPVVATSVGGTSYEFTDNEIYLIEPDSVSEIRFAIEEILTNKTVREKYLRFCKKRADRWIKMGCPTAQHSQILLGK